MKHDYIPAPGGSGSTGGTSVSSSGTNTISVTVAMSQNMFVQASTATNTYALPTGDLSAYIGATKSPLKYIFCKNNANNLTIDPGAATSNIIANGTASQKLVNSTAGETYATVSLQLISSSASVNIWVVVGGHGTWTPTP